MLGEKRQYLTIKILHNNMTVMVPCENADRAGLRRVIGEDDVKKVLAVLRDDVSQMPKNWNRRFKHNREKIKTGDVFELAEVVRNLAIRETEKGLSTGEKQMYTRAKKILASELMYALDMEEDEAESHLEGLISEAHTSRHRRARYGLAHTLSVVGIIPAGGSGERLGADGPKAFAVLAGKPMLEWSLAALGGVVRARGGGRAGGVRGPARSRARRRGAARRRCATPWRPRPRPPWRSCTTPRARSSRRELVERCLRALEGCEAAIAAARVTDTVKEDDGAGRVVRTLDARPALVGADPAGVPRRRAAQRARRGRGAAGRRHRRRLARGGGRG